MAGDHPPHILATTDQQLGVELLKVPGLRNRYPVVAQKVAGFALDATLLVRLRRRAEVTCEAPMRAESDEPRGLLAPMAAQDLLYRALEIVVPLSSRKTQTVVGVSTRRYARSLEPQPEEIAVRGISKSAVSERFVVGTERRLVELMQRDRSGLKLVALLIDKVHFAEHVLLAAVGIDLGGKKHVPGLRERGRPRTPPRARRCWPT
jgi:hypothetical protein